jgi:glycine/D-amino acid oxidase-like deaminating enzyme
VKTVVVVGGGIAGLAAAFAAKRLAPESNVVLVTGRLGATELTPGALDDRPWDEVERAEALLGRTDAPREELPPSLREFVDALGLFATDAANRPLVATSGGILRRCAVAPRAGLDLDACRGKLVLLPDLDRQGWDATSLARSLAADRRAPEVEVASALSLRFVATTIRTASGGWGASSLARRSTPVARSRSSSDRGSVSRLTPQRCSRSR